MTVKIEFPKDEEAKDSLERVTLITEAVMDFKFVVNGQPLLYEISKHEYHADWFFMFLKVSLGILPELHKGRTKQFEFEMQTTLVFKPDNETITTYLAADDGSVSGDQYEMELQAFAQEAIKTSEEFLEFALEVRPDQREDPAVETFRTVLADAKTWYQETYDEVT